MHRNVSAPARFFSQVPNEIIRHPRLSPDAKCLLLWQLSLPGDLDQPFYTTAQRAGIKKTAFTRAKRQLIAEGYFHDWRRQGPDGRWATEQLISNVPLTREEAAAVRDGKQPPGAADPAPGEPSRRAVGRSPEKTEGNTSHPPLPPAEEADEVDEAGQAEGEEPARGAHTERGARLLAALVRTDRRLRLGGGDVRQLAPLAGEWLLRGVTPHDLHEALTSGLPDRLRSPAGILRDRLTRKMPEPPAHGPAPEGVPRPRPLRACAGRCGRVIRPLGDETHCRDCRTQGAVDREGGAVAATRRGVAAVQAAMLGAACLP
ncbi:hypothetical protein BLA24_24840 [Streptomyces cinnamoneus]|uniref:Helix-turn-helix domain-containing protein n=1 Tax=Streptomyces cinnamoneus TaxID=53446 RepID=A0A2G1XDP4_STRCJ|nr:hypothetical protein [Streptomyces cinnamoneus]PHQ49289.1 hypothetical protein BLA24_24840 [Streptomyces cinnamoneus]PPT15061.1 hypothetical protein CYQ11_21230 [Streptomyces cinnamoneus]